MSAHRAMVLDTSVICSFSGMGVEEHWRKYSALWDKWEKEGVKEEEGGAKDTK